MELHNQMEALLEKYFEATATMQEEQQLKAYFAAKDISPALAPYASMFAFYENEGRQTFQFAFPQPPKQRPRLAWISVAASAAIMLGVGTFAYFHQTPTNLGTFQTPEEAYTETEKALELLSRHVNRGVQSVEYVNQYENSKKIIFNH